MFVSLNGHAPNSSAISLWKRNRINYWITVAQVTGGEIICLRAQVLQNATEPDTLHGEAGAAYLGLLV